MPNNMVQFGIWSNCCNDCDFCLREERTPYTKEKQLLMIEAIKKNIDIIDWEHDFDYGISILGGEIYYITDKDIQDAYMSLIDKIIDKILLPSKNPNCKYSTVTNGLYDPKFLYRVIDRIIERAGLRFVDVNFSYDLKYRYKTEEKRLLVLKNINDFHKRYNYSVCVQMILTQYVINLWKEGKFDVNKFEQEEIPGNMLSFLYPHPIHTGIKLDDFNFNRKDFLQFLMYLRKSNPRVYASFLLSTKNSGTFKYSGLRDRTFDNDFARQKPILSDGKEIINPKCSHSTLYQCYTDTDKCMLCDLLNFDRGMY